MRGPLRADQRTQRDDAMRLKRFAAHFDRWCRGEPVKSYDTKWLAYLRERQLDQRPTKTDCSHRANY